MKAPLPSLTSSTSDCNPAASFFDRMLAVMSGNDSTVAVTSRMAYSRRSAGASVALASRRSADAIVALAPTMAQPAPRKVASSRARSTSTV